MLIAYYSVIGMGKWAKYEKRYCEKWEKEPKLKRWIQKVLSDECKAYCKCEIRAHRNDLLSHASTAKHLKNAAPFSSQRSLFDVGCSKVVLDTSIKVAELKVAAHIACHSSISTVNHLGELLCSISGKDFAIHRTKCTVLIKQVLAPSMENDLRKDIGENCYSLIIDESTDITAHKQLCVIVRYFSRSLKRIVSSFLGLITLESGTAIAIFNALMSFLKSKNISPDKCVGIGTDGCNTMYGNTNSVITKFRESVKPDIIHVKCICHSLQLCSSYALKVMPRNVEFMVSETYRWFCHSTARQIKYRDLYSCINVGENPLKILKVCDTRWLSIAPCVDRILSQYVELKLHFQIAQDEEKNFTAKLLYEMYEAPENKLYLIFLRPILTELNRVNKLFQLDNGSPLKLIEELMNLYLWIMDRILRPLAVKTWDAILACDIDCQANYRPIGAINFGVEFAIELSEHNLENSPLALTVKHRCCNYLEELLSEMRKRLPENVKKLQSLASLSPSVVLGPQKPQFCELPFLLFCTTNVSALELQWSKLHLLSWKNTSDAQTEQFWSEVLFYTDAAGDCPLEDIAKFALTVLSLPFSNAAVERSFSQMALIKTKLRNRMQQPLLEAILHVRAYMSRHHICCSAFKPSKDMLSLFTSNM